MPIYTADQIHSARDFKVFNKLDPQQKVILFNEIVSEGKLPEIIEQAQTIKDNLLLLDVIEKCAEANLKILYSENIFNKLIALIKNTKDFNTLAIHFTPDQCRLLCENLPLNLLIPQISGMNVIRALKDLTLDKRLIIWDYLQNNLQELIPEFFILEYVLKNRAPEEIELLCNNLKQQLSSWIDENTFFYACEAISPSSDFSAARMEFITHIKNLLPDIINEKNISQLDKLSADEKKYIVNQITPSCLSENIRTSSSPSSLWSRNPPAVNDPPNDEEKKPTTKP